MRVLGGVGRVPDRASDGMAGGEEAGDDRRGQVARRAGHADDGLLRALFELREGLAELLLRRRRRHDAAEERRSDSTRARERDTALKTKKKNKGKKM